jgi:tRNA-uridine 2-sulfurtransferase
MSKTTQSTVIVGISGGVDSAVAAVLLLEQGYTVQGLHMTNWDEDDAYCESARDFQDARQVCAELGIPLHHVNFAREYRDKVFAHFLDECRRGRTPNPDVACNRQIKFGDCYDYAVRLGADYVATGHYARIQQSPDRPCLLKGIDPGKDQSYFLHAVRPETLSRVLFPLGELHKAEVREIANRRGLPNFARRDSTGICFIGERPFRQFLQGYIPAQPGRIETPDGQVVGCHDGLAFYTIGQRQGLGIGGMQNFAAAPWFVAEKDIARNVLIAVQGQDHPLLWSAGLKTEEVTWLRQPENRQFQCSVKTRYRQPDIPCDVELDAGGSARVLFQAPVWAVTPGQYAVFYAGDECLGGAVIGSRECSTNSVLRSAQAGSA